MRKASGLKTNARVGDRDGLRVGGSKLVRMRAGSGFSTAADIASFMLNPEAQMIFFKAATTYVKDKNDELQIPAQWLADLDQPINSSSRRKGPHLRWLPARLLPKKRGIALPFDPTVSHPYVRWGADKRPYVLLVLLASLVWPEQRRKRDWVLGGGQGVRVIARIIADPLGVRIVAVSGSASLPAVPGGKVEAWSKSLTDSDVAFLLAGNSDPRWPDAAGLDSKLYGTHSVGISLLDPDENDSGQPSSRFICRLVPTRVPSANNPARVVDAPAHAVEAMIRSVGENKPPTLEGIVRQPLFTQLTKKAFRQDPPTFKGSRVLSPRPSPGGLDGRPHQPPVDLNKFRQKVNLGSLPASGPKGKKLADPKGRFFIAQSRHVEGGAPGFDENKPAIIKNSTDYASRSDGFAAINAFWRAREFFFRLDDLYKLPMDMHFAFAQLPLIVRYRAGVVPGAGDGRTINAQVRWAPTTPPTAFPGNLEMRLALADLQSNEGRVSAVRRTNNVPRSPLSIAASPRWSWHEFGHVLIAGATGSLELEFAHSVGDALGAILSDPKSALARANEFPKWRGLTFPWQSMPNRRHDRDASEGWSWSGTLARPDRIFPGINGHHVLNRSGYRSEQLMSSSLFRLYRTLGGDAKAPSGKIDERMREVAAEHTVALIMAAIGTLGPSSVSVLRTADYFADALIAVDSEMPPLTIRQRTRYGGLAGKAARWAFEQQGAFAPPSQVAWAHNAAGMAPPCDIYIASRRGGDPGGYAPVSFADDGHLADRNKVWIRNAPTGSAHQEPQGGASNFVFVKVANRGQILASNTQVRAWRARLTPAGNIPRWNSAAWAELAPNQSGGEGPKNVPTGAGGVRFGPFRWDDAKSGMRYALVVSATCVDDPSNLDPTVALPCASAASNVNELVAFDNNLGLILVRAT